MKKKRIIYYVIFICTFMLIIAMVSAYDTNKNLQDQELKQDEYISSEESNLKITSNIITNITTQNAVTNNSENIHFSGIELLVILILIILSIIGILLQDL